MESRFHRFQSSQRQGFGLRWDSKHQRRFGQAYDRTEPSSHSSSYSSNSRVLSTLPPVGGMGTS